MNARYGCSVVALMVHRHHAIRRATGAGAMAFVSKRAIGSQLMQVLEDLMKERQAKQQDR
jgi:hypothetical protein